MESVRYNILSTTMVTFDKPGVIIATHNIRVVSALEVIRRNSFQKEIVAKKLEGPDNPQKYKYELIAKHLVQFLMNIRKVCSIIPGYDNEE